MKDHIKYTDYQGKELPNHDGTMIEIKDEGYQFFDINGKGFIHDGSMVSLPDGRAQFFLHNGKAIIHDGSPIELPDGRMQYFDHDGLPIWPIDEKKLTPLFTQQRKAFFDNRISYINKQTPLEKNEVEELRLALLAAEHPDSIQQGIAGANNLEIEQIKIEPISKETAGYLILLKGFWCQIWKAFQLRHKEKLSARFILRQYGDNKCQLAKNSLAASVLSDELKREFKKVDRKFKHINTDTIQEIGTNEEGVFILDELLIQYCKESSKGEGTSSFIKQFEESYKDHNTNIESRKKSWSHPLYLYRCLANNIWLDRVKKRIETLQKKPPALTYVVNEQVHKPLRRGTWYDQGTGQLLDARGKEVALIDKNDENNVPTMELEIIQKMLVAKNINVLSSVNAHRLLRWQVQTVTKQFIEGQADARALRVRGGFQELAKLVGAGTGRSAPDQLHKIIIWQAHSRFKDGNGGYGNMLSYNITPGGRKRSAVISLILGDMMLPHYVFQILGLSQNARENRRLIPIVDMPPLIGRANEQGAQATFQMELLVEMRKGAKEFAEYGSVLITPDRLAELAKISELSNKVLPKVIDRWTHEDDDKSAFLKIVDTDRYCLGHSFNQAQDFIIQAGENEMRGSTAGRKSRTRKSYAKNKKK